jgi:hypothetical protein
VATQSGATPHRQPTCIICRQRYELSNGNGWIATRLSLFSGLNGHSPGLGETGPLLTRLARLDSRASLSEYLWDKMEGPPARSRPVRN